MIEFLATLWSKLRKEATPASLTGATNPPTGERHISPTGLAMVKHFESFFPRAYQDAVGVWTIGWGHTGLTHQDGTVRPGRVITREEGERLLAHDMRQFEGDVSSLVKVPLAQHEFDALVSFAFNLGAGNLKSSTLLRKLNAGDLAGAAAEFLKWDKAGGKVLRGLTRRRNAEAAMFRGGDWEAWAS